MTDDITPAELSRAMDRFASALDKFANRLDSISERLDKLPTAIDERYVRKDVLREQSRRVDGALAELAAAIKETNENGERQFERLSNNVRWFFGVVLVPVALAVWALLHTTGSVG